MNPSRPDRAWLYVALTFVVFWMVVLRFFNPLAPSNVPRLGQSGTGAVVDFQWALRDLDGKPVAFSQYQGKAIFLNVWATWCPPCVKEMPSIARLAANPKLKDVVFLCASIDDSIEPVKTFLHGKNWPMTVVHSGEVPSVFSTEGIPATFLIGPDGRVASSEIGSTDWDTPEVIAFLEKLAKGEPAKR